MSDNEKLCFFFLIIVIFIKKKKSIKIDLTVKTSTFFLLLMETPI